MLDAGVYAIARLGPARRRAIAFTSDVADPLPISEEVARRLLRGRNASIEVELRHELPVGQGFGMSAAGATATALAVARLLGVERGIAVGTAHLADLYGRGGLGGVASILGGGLELRRRPGVPPWGSVEHRPFPLPIVVAVLGPPIPSVGPLSDDALLERVRDAATPALAQLGRSLTPGRFLMEAERFTDELSLGSPRVHRVIRGLRGPGIRVAQAMFGESLFAVAANGQARRRLLRRLERRRLPALLLGAARSGARGVSVRGRSPAAGQAS
ncbi:MAG: hypothetical protein L3K09_03500 [Thermoplasmata archaeon]|nr:hypothetical protein [Thermoplasmata archaeon]